MKKYLFPALAFAAALAIPDSAALAQHGHGHRGGHDGHGTHAGAGHGHHRASPHARGHHKSPHFVFRAGRHGPSVAVIHRGRHSLFRLHNYRHGFGDSFFGRRHASKRAHEAFEAYRHYEHRRGFHARRRAHEAREAYEHYRHRAYGPNRRHGYGVYGDYLRTHPRD